MSKLLENYRQNYGPTRRAFLDALQDYWAESEIPEIKQMDESAVLIAESTLGNYERGIRYPNRGFLMLLVAFLASEKEFTNRMEANRFVDSLIIPNEAPGLTDQEFVTYVEPYLEWREQHQLSIEHHVQECQTDLMMTLAQIPPNQPVVVEMLSLNLWFAWSALIKGMETLKHTDITIHALMMSGRPDDMGNYIPDEVKEWSNIVSASQDRILQTSQGFGEAFKLEGKRTRLEVRQYHVMPYIQGFRIAKPAEFAVTYVSFCRWVKPTFQRYDWGEYHFLQIKPNDVVSPNEYERYILELFENTYQHHWRANPEAVIRYDNFAETVNS
ncbi:MAG: hypothetical protein AAF702_11810 [Chloroflexota bacterium]